MTYLPEYTRSGLQPRRMLESIAAPAAAQTTVDAATL